jgi:hypothetical protein
MHDTLRLVMVPALLVSACGDDEALVPRTPRSDSIPPAVVGLSPVPGDTGVPLLVTVEVTFSEALNWATVGPASFFLTRQADPVAGGYVVDGLTAAFVPEQALDSVTVYEVTLTGAVRDSAGNALPADTSWSFRTGAVAIPAGRTTR